MAGECTFVVWWCELLLGMVHERGGRPTEAAAYFRSALPESDPALAALLTGIGDLLEGKDRSAYQRLTGRYTPATYGPVFQVPAQFARFREEDSLVVLAAARLDGAQLVAPRTVFLVSDGPGSFPVCVRRRSRLATASYALC